jgi:hypothetical protein
MRVESPLVSQSLIESSKTIEKKEVNVNSLRDREPSEDSPSFVPSPFGSSGTYSVSSLRAAVDYHAKFLTVAQNNLEAAKHPGTIPKMILDRLIG